MNFVPALDEYIFFFFPAKNERTIMHEFTPGSGDDRHAQCQFVPDLSHACHTNLSSLRDTKHSHITHFTLEGRARFLSVPLASFSFFLSACLPAILVSCLFFPRERTQNSELYYSRIKILGSCLFLQSVPANLHAKG